MAFSTRLASPAAWLLSIAIVSTGNSLFGHVHGAAKERAGEKHNEHAQAQSPPLFSPSRHHGFATVVTFPSAVSDTHSTQACPQTTTAHLAVRETKAKCQAGTGSCSPLSLARYRPPRAQKLQLLMVDDNNKERQSCCCQEGGLWWGRGDTTWQVSALQRDRCLTRRHCSLRSTKAGAVTNQASPFKPRT